MDADLILTNGIVYTVDPARSRHAAVAVRGGRIVSVGSAADVAALAGRRTTVVDLAGRLVLPGFIDAHMHPKNATGALFEVYLGGCRSLAECLGAVERLAAEHPEYPAVRGWGWTPTTVREGEMTAAALDAVVPDRPAVLADDSVHTHWVNSVMLDMAGITRDTPDPDGGVDRASARTGARRGCCARRGSGSSALCRPTTKRRWSRLCGTSSATPRGATVSRPCTRRACSLASRPSMPTSRCRGRRSSASASASP